MRHDDGSYRSLLRRPRPLGSLVALVSLTFGSLGVAGVGVSSAIVIPPSWAIVSSASPPAPSTGALHGVACPTSTNCFVVGSGGEDAPLVGRSNGTSWSTGSGASPAPFTIGSRLASVSCPSVTACVAVGDFFDTSDAVQKVLVETWDGTSWSLGAGVHPAGATASKLTGVACVSAASCVAVGFATYGGNTDSPTNQALVERWDGTSWSIAGGTVPAGADSSQLSGVACSSPTSCYAVGSFLVAGAPRNTVSGLVERWDGTVWSVLSTPNAPTVTVFGNRVTELRSVSCPTSVSCIAVGDYATDVRNEFSGGPNVAPLVEQLVGSSGTLTFPPNPSVADSTELDAVSCPTSSSCFAVGKDADLVGVGSNTLAERFDGTTWSIVPGSKTPAGPIGYFDGVSCSTSTDCVVVGGGYEAHIERWDGARLARVVGGGSQSELRAASCTSLSSCFAVGDSSDGIVRKPLVEHWNGTQWSLAPNPVPAGLTYGLLNSVSCPTSTTCFAVGNYAAKRALPLIERWNGNRWSMVSAPVPSGATGSTLSSVACATATSCFAAGVSTTGKGFKVLFDRWDGKKWSLVPGPKGPVVSISGISCPVVTRCFAVGAFDSGGADAAMILRWDGTRWSFMVGLNRADALSGISCATATSCFAVGSVAGHGPQNVNTSRTLIVRWNGKRWTTVASADPVGFNQLASVSCASPERCAAVGTSTTREFGEDTSLPLTERWNGSRWSIDPSPHPNGVSVSVISGVSCPTTYYCLAVGSYTTAGSKWTLAERYA